MYKNIILLVLFSQFLLGCSIKKDKDLTVSVDCPKHFFISEAINKPYSNKALLVLKNDLIMNCYQNMSVSDAIFFNILTKYEVVNTPKFEVFEDTFTSLLFITDRDETIKLSSNEENIAFSNTKKWGSKVKTPYLNKIEIQHVTLIKIDLKDYQNGVRVFAAVN